MDRDLASVEDMVYSALKVIERTENCSLEDFAEDEILHDSVIRRFEIIGEAARRISEDFRAKHEGIPWQSAIGPRNILAHEYDRTDSAVVWRTARQNLPSLVDQLRSLLDHCLDENLDS